MFHKRIGRDGLVFLGLVTLLIGLIVYYILSPGAAVALRDEGPWYGNWVAIAFAVLPGHHRLPGSVADAYHADYVPNPDGYVLPAWPDARRLNWKRVLGRGTLTINVESLCSFPVPESDAQLKVKEAVSGISKDLSDVGHAIERAEARIRGMQARLEAIDELMASGALDDVLMPGDDIDQELARLSLAAAVEKELEQLKADLTV